MYKSFQNYQMPSNEQSDIQKITCCPRLLFLVLFQLVAFFSYAQYYEEKPEPEFGIGIKVLKGDIIYGPKSFYIADPKAICLQALVRYDAPVKIYSRSPYQQRYINFVLESGFLFCKANVFDSVLVDPITNTITHEKSRNPTYLPVYMGLYNRSVFSIGAEVFYWKGLGARDIWGAKFLSLGYNGQSFRVTVSGEWYAQTKNIKNSGLFFSIDFLWKLIVSD
jgi:hypothetical protein